MATCRASSGENDESPTNATNATTLASCCLNVTAILLSSGPSPPMTPAATFFSFAFLLAAFYCGLDPFHHSAIYGFPAFKACRVAMPDWSTLPSEADNDNRLQKSEIRFLNEVQGPESLAFDAQGRGPYTGVADGRVVFWDGSQWNDFAYTSSNRTGNCDRKSSILHYLKNEHICGRPLGLRFNKRTGDLYIADPYFGLMKVGPEGGLATSLATEADGGPLTFTNDLDVDEDGVVYFTDSSSVYQRRNFIQLVFSSEDTGRILKYDPSTKRTTVLVKHLQFPNGITLSKDGSFLVFCEGSKGLLHKYWLKGEKAGSTEVLAILPGYPDNVRTNKEGNFWVAIHSRRNLYSHIMALYPGLRLFFLKLPISAKIQYFTHLGFRMHAIVAKYSPEGKLLTILEDSQGKVLKAVSEVEEHDGALWIGSVLMPFIGVYKL